MAYISFGQNTLTMAALNRYFSDLFSNRSATDDMLTMNSSHPRIGQKPRRAKSSPLANVFLFDDNAPYLLCKPVHLSPGDTSTSTNSTAEDDSSEDANIPVRRRKQRVRDLKDKVPEPPISSPPSSCDGQRRHKTRKKLHGEPSSRNIHSTSTGRNRASELEQTNRSNRVKRVQESRSQLPSGEKWHKQIVHTSDKLREHSRSSKRRTVNRDNLEQERQMRSQGVGRAQSNQETSGYSQQDTSAARRKYDEDKPSRNGAKKGDNSSTQSPEQPDSQSDKPGAIGSPRHGQRKHRPRHKHHSGQARDKDRSSSKQERLLELARKVSNDHKMRQAATSHREHVRSSSLRSNRKVDAATRSILSNHGHSSLESLCGMDSTLQEDTERGGGSMESSCHSLPPIPPRMNTSQDENQSSERKSERRVPSHRGLTSPPLPPTSRPVSNANTGWQGHSMSNSELGTICASVPGSKSRARQNPRLPTGRSYSTGELPTQSCVSTLEVVSLRGDHEVCDRQVEVASIVSMDSEADSLDTDFQEEEGSVRLVRTFSDGNMSGVIELEYLQLCVTPKPNQIQFDSLPNQFVSPATQERKGFFRRIHDRASPLLVGRKKAPLLPPLPPSTAHHRP